MCDQSYSESGAITCIKGCKEFVLLASDRDRLAGVVAGMEEQNARNLDALRRAKAENARLELTLKRQARAMHNYQSAEAKIASAKLESARRLAAECDPANIESEKQMNAILTEENARLREALKFYANNKNYYPSSDPILIDDGETARNAIKEVG